MLKLLLVLVGIYLLVCAVAFTLQDKALFAVDAAGAAGPLPPGAERLELTAPNGTRLVGIHVAPSRRDAKLPIILGFGGNAWNAANAAEYLRDLYPGADIVAFHYRGYAPSGGKPSAAALLDDSLAVHDAVAARFPGRPIVAVGFSIGAGVAAHVASRRPVAGAILVTPFDSLTEVAAGHYPWLPVRLLFRNRMEPAAELRETRLPVAILAGGRDALVPGARTDALRKAVPNLVYNRTIPSAGHNDIYHLSAFQLAMREALGKVAASR